MSVAHRTAARILSKGLKEGRYGGELAIDDMPYMALVSTSGTDSVVTDSANSMSAYTTGHKSCVNALGVYCARNKNSPRPPESRNHCRIGEEARRYGGRRRHQHRGRGRHPRPAWSPTTRRRADYNDIVGMFYQVKPDVIMGGGSPNFLPKTTPGSKRLDEQDYLKQFQDAGYSLVTTNSE